MFSYLYLSLSDKRQYRKTENGWRETGVITNVPSQNQDHSYMRVLTLIYQEVIKWETLLRKKKLQTIHSIPHTNAKKQKTSFGKVSLFCSK